MAALVVAVDGTTIVVVVVDGGGVVVVRNVVVVVAVVEVWCDGAERCANVPALPGSSPTAFGLARSLRPSPLLLLFVAVDGCHRCRPTLFA